jgi:hypothetical protein
LIIEVMHFFPHRTPWLIPDGSVTFNQLNGDMFLKVVPNAKNCGPKGRFRHIGRCSPQRSIREIFGLYDLSYNGI